MSLPKTDEAAIRQVIRALVAEGFVLDFVDDGEEAVPTKNETEAIEAITAVDEARLYVLEPGKPGHHGWVYFVLGNDPEEVAADYTVNLTPVDALIDRWIEEN